MPSTLIIHSHAPCSLASQGLPLAGRRWQGLHPRGRARLGEGLQGARGRPRARRHERAEEAARTRLPVSMPGGRLAARPPCRACTLRASSRLAARLAARPPCRACSPPSTRRRPIRHAQPVVDLRRLRDLQGRGLAQGRGHHHLLPGRLPPPWQHVVGVGGDPHITSFSNATRPAGGDIPGRSGWLPCLCAPVCSRRERFNHHGRTQGHRVAARR